ncbi:MAG TPA: hypothetical protein VHL31_00810 [Geminicoccus sp.]|uniref:calcium-binding protein n=1 Tax=Geminicoccus sp. TaxID=2024832 RepID=UPI002E363062|nr:hypothetical protein [Geminicoccus sp.]HEX2524831.1 hypothetical protein [Geminicoccus sp.]
MSTENGQGLDLSGDGWVYSEGLASLVEGPSTDLTATDPAVDDAEASDAAWAYGTPLDDLIQGSADPEVLIGNGGDDTIQCFAGNDFVDAGPGDDFVIADGGFGAVEAGSGDDYVHVSEAGSRTISLGSGADSLEFVAYGEGQGFGVHRILDYDIFQDGPLSIVAYQDSGDAGEVPRLDSNGDGVIDGFDLGVTVVDGALVIDLSIAWYHDLSIGSSMITLDGMTSLPVDIVG